MMKKEISGIDMKRVRYKSNILFLLIISFFMKRKIRKLLESTKRIIKEQQS